MPASAARVVLELKASFCRTFGQPLVVRQPIIGAAVFLRMRPLLEQMQPETLGEDEENRGADFPCFKHRTMLEQHLLAIPAAWYCFLIILCLGASEGFLFLMPNTGFRATLPDSYRWRH